MERYRVLLADDEAEIRQGISRKIDWAARGFELAGEAENGAEALELAEQIRPDVVLTDIKMPFMDGLELCRRLRRTLPAAKLVVFSGFDEFEYARQAVSMGVSEYIMKPINARELEEVLESLRAQLEAQRQQRRDMETLRRRYEESLPVLRELFFARMLDGRIPPDQLAERAARYELELPGGPWAAALVSMDLPASGQSAERDELLLLSVRSFVEEHFELPGCWLRALLHNDAVAILAGLESADRLYPLMAELERLCALAPSCLGLRLTVGLGRPVAEAGQLGLSMEGARSALDYRLLMGGGRVLYIGDLEPDASLRLSLDDEDQRALATAVKLGTEQQLDTTVRDLVERMRASRLPPAQCQLYVLEIVTCLVRLARSGGVEVEDVFGPGFAGAVPVAEFAGLDQLGEWLAGCCRRLRELLGRRRTDSTGRTVEAAKAFIADHFADSELGVETVCAHLHLSPTYFSTLFKRETGKSFTAWVTDLRMAEAARLLRQTDEKTYLIAEKTGYIDPNYFSYVFKRRYGVTPSKYRAGQA